MAGSFTNQYTNSVQKQLTHTQTVCTRPSPPPRGPGDEASTNPANLLILTHQTTYILTLNLHLYLTIRMDNSSTMMIAFVMKVVSHNTDRHPIMPSVLIGSKNKITSIFGQNFFHNPCNRCHGQSLKHYLCNPLLNCFKSSLMSHNMQIYLTD